MKRRLFRWGVLLIVLGVVMGVMTMTYRFSDADRASSSERNTDALTTITLIQTPWKSSVANNTVARILLEEELGYTVKIVDMPDDRDQARTLITGETSVNLEIWSSGVTSTFKRYLEADIIVNMGPLGVTGQAGWYIPTYLHNEYPVLTRWENLQEPEIVDLFASQRMDGHGMLLSGDPTWDAYLEMLVGNLELPYDVVYTGSERTFLDALDHIYQNQEPVLFYLWEPHPFHSQYELTRIQLPRYSEECYALIESGGVNCDYPRDILFKVAHPGLEQQAPEAFAFVRGFFYPSNELQLSLMEAIESSTTAEVGARHWLRENEDVWRVWLSDNAQKAPSMTQSQS